MSKNDRVITDTSRRNFTKAACATLLSVPLLGACSSKSPKGEETSKPTSVLPKESRGFTTQLGPGIEEHIPPMGLTDGSLDFELYDAFNPIDGQQVGNKYVYKLPSFGNIKKVMVTVTNEMDLYTQYYSLIGKPFCDPENIVIKMWLQERQGSGYKPVNVALPPEVLITSPGMLQMEINEKLARRPKNKNPYRPYKYEHEGNGYNDHFRIGVLDISSTNCPVTANSAHWVTRDLDHYRIWIFGPNIDPQ